MIPGWKDRDALRAALMSWFVASRRDLPWRSRESLYGIWVAEIMLQQTTVEAVVPFYQRFLARFPDVQTLARSSVDEVMALWSGLGYYRRAAMLHRAAGIIVAERGGRFPASSREWHQLPGVGDYASGAIASLGLGERVPAVDANARRVLLRWLCATGAYAAVVGKARLKEWAEDIVDPDAPGDWNEAVMELGALVCRARHPKCADCPVSRWCRAAESADPATIPPLAAPPDRVRVTLAQLLITDGVKVLLMPPGATPAVPAPRGFAVAREDFSGLFRGMCGLPSTPWLHASTDQVLAPGEIWSDFLPLVHGILAPGHIDFAGSCRHAVTRFDLQIQVHRILVDSACLTRGRTWPPGWRVAGLSAPGVPISRLTTKVLGIARTEG